MMHLFSVCTHLLMISSSLLANHHQIYVSSLDLSHKLQTQKFVSTWMATRHPKLNMSKTELSISPSMLLENGNDSASLSVD